MFRRKCKHCKEFFFTNRRRQKFCCKECRIDYEEVRSKFRTDSGKGQPCWICQNSCGGCSWSKELKPVEGWRARSVTVKNKEGDSYRTYRILSCPKFIQETDIRILK